MGVLIRDWVVRDFAPGEGRPETVAREGAEGWTPIQAPGDLYAALVAAGRIEHPFEGLAEAASAWVRDREWWWCAQFDARVRSPGQRVYLVFEGLDTFATIWVNGAYLGATDNMFAPLRLDVTRALADSGVNQVLIRFDPPSLRLADKHMDTWPIIADPIQQSKRNFVRKAQFGWGWDWAPSLPTVGVWRDVHLEHRRGARLAEVRFQTLSLGDPARVRVSVAVDAWIEASLDVQITLNDANGILSARAAMVSGRSGVAAELEISGPRLWWTPELGEAHLYELTVELWSNGELLDLSRQQVGIRTVVLDQSPDPGEPGCTHFRFLLNGAALFARGANWAPANSMLGTVTRDQLTDLLQRAQAANMNMVRVWGGGVYEHDDFYAACDRLGLLVWQDFMFACAPYPEGDEAFVSSVRNEVSSQIRRLRSHPCLALWCGNNEGDAVQAFMNRLSGVDTPFSGDLYIHRVIPELLGELDPDTPYWPGSPSGGPSHNSMRAGDVHNWTVWHGLPPTPDAEPVGGFDHSPEGVAYTRYAEDMCRFVSEFGIQAAPALATLKRWGGADVLNLGSEAFTHRIKDHPKDKVLAMLSSVTGLPQTVEQYVDFTQLVQAEGLKFGVEHYRRRRPHCSGALVWQLNDCWPGISWSLIDHDGVAKPSWYAVRRAFAPLMGSFRAVDGEGIEFWVVNDAARERAFTAEVSLQSLDGRVAWSRSIEGVAPALSSQCVERFDAAGGANQVLLLRSEQFPANRHFLAPLKEISFRGRPRLASGLDDRGGLTLEVSADTYCHCVVLTAEDPAVRFDDNAFDLAAGERRHVAVTGPQRLRPGDISVRSRLQG